MSYFNAFFFGIYPYIALSIFLLGSLDEHRPIVAPDTA